MFFLYFRPAGVWDEILNEMVPILMSSIPTLKTYVTSYKIHLLIYSSIVSGDFHIVKPSLKKSNHLASGDDLPSTFKVHFSLKGRNFTLLLQRNYHINTDIPISVERYGKLIYQPINDSKKIAYYYDAEQGCSVMAKPAKRKHQHGLELFGTVHIDPNVYLIQPPDDTHPTHSLTQIQRNNSSKEDSVADGPQDNIIQGIVNPKPNFQHRNRRRTNTMYEVEILVVVEFSVYISWRNRLTGNASVLLDVQAKNNLRQYYTLLIHTTNLFYQSVTGRGYGIKLLLAGLQISDKISTSWWTESLKASSPFKSQDSIDSQIALKRFRDWVADYAYQLPGFYHAMLFTRYGLLDLVF